MRSEPLAIVLMPSTTDCTACVPAEALSTDFLASSEISRRLPDTLSMVARACIIELVPCSAAAACDCACSATRSTDALSSSMDALVLSMVEAWVCAPSESFCALSEIRVLDEASSTASCWTAATMADSFTDIPLSASASSPTSSR